MAVQFELEQDKALIVKDLISVQALDRGYFGKESPLTKAHLILMPEEALYLMDVRGATAIHKGKNVSFNRVAREFINNKKFLARYFCYRDWRDRGIIARPIEEAKENYGRSPVVKYPSKDFESPKVNSKALFFSDDLMSIIDEDEEGRLLYEANWFGQYGTYKAKKHGRYLKLDAYETLFLMKHGNMKANIGEKKIIKECMKRRSDFLALYEVYEDWRMRGFVVKSGFKFGTHFRLYFPGAAPTLANEEWMHSKHVIHVFPRSAKMLISEWSRAIRVAHGVKKTFILAIPGEKKQAAGELDFVLYHRKKGGLIENPKEDKPKFVMLALSEEEEIGGEELSESIQKSKSFGLDLILAICDRESSITYYRVKRIELPKSKYEYYEIEWKQP
ncbi:MAG: tRNA-intron lyase [Candidatus Micrarchaeota archaeon]